MSEPVFLIETRMEIEDYRKFLYTATFCRNKLMIPFVILIAFAGSLIVNWSDGHFQLIPIVITWIFMTVSAIGAILFKVERKNKQRIKSDKTGTFGSINTLKFYDDKVIMEIKELHSSGELRYDQIYRLMESREYFIFYLTMNQASLIRKKDVDNIGSFRNFLMLKFQKRYKKI